MRRALIFAHYDPNGGISPLAEHLLKSAAALASCVVFVSDSILTASAHSIASNISDRVLTRNNYGYDFVSYKLGLEALRELHPGLPFDELIFCNDSVFGPVVDLASWILSAADLPEAAWAATLSYEKCKHMQTYFFAVRPKLFRDPVFWKFWEDVRVLPSKKKIILEYEIGLSKWLAKNNYNIAGMFDIARLSYASLVRELLAVHKWSNINDLKWCLTHARELNPTHYFARRMLKDGHPFIKRDLVRTNPMKLNLSSILGNLAPSWRAALQECGSAAEP